MPLSDGSQNETVLRSTYNQPNGSISAEADLIQPDGTVMANHAERPMNAVTTRMPTRRILRRSSFMNSPPRDYISVSSARAMRSMSRASSSAFMEEMPRRMPIDKQLLTKDEPP